MDEKVKVEEISWGKWQLLGDTEKTRIRDKAAGVQKEIYCMSEKY